MRSAIGKYGAGRREQRIVALVIAAALALAACGSDDDDSADTDPPADDATTAAVATTTGQSAAATEPDGTAASSDASAPSGDPIVIGAAIDQTSFMAPFDEPPVVAAQLTIEAINAAGGVLGRPLELQVIDTQLQPEQTLSAAIDLLDGGAEILMVTCDVDFATPAIQEALERGVLAIAACIGTDQMGPNRFGETGSLAFSFGNVAQDEGAAMAEYAIEQGWTSAVVARDNLLVYSQDVIDAFIARFEQLGGTADKQEQFTGGDGTIGSVVSAVADSGADVIVTSATLSDLPALVEGVRSLGDETPFLCGWSCDGTYWMPPSLSEFYYLTFASVFGDDPSEAVNEMLAAMTDAGSAPATGGFITGADAIRTLAAAIEATGGTDSVELSAHLEGLTDFAAPTGPISFSPEWHTVFGREYRLVKVDGGTPGFVELRRADSPADI